MLTPCMGSTGCAALLRRRLAAAVVALLAVLLATGPHAGLAASYNVLALSQ